MADEKYTPEPWPEDGAVILQQPHDPGVRADNFERARACVNALAGIPTHALESALVVVAKVQYNDEEITEYASERRLEDHNGDEEGNPDLPPTA